MSTPSDKAPRGTVRVWDGFLRLFHWGLATSFLVGYFFTQDAWLHENAGYIALTLVALRIPWGFIGPKHARFSDFLYKPRTAVGYLLDLPRGKAKGYLGHTPPGGYNIIALLTLVIVVCLSGILMNTDMFWGNALVEDIHYIAADVTMAFVVLHWCGVLASSLAHRENLVKAMITGRRRAPAAEIPEAAPEPAAEGIEPQWRPGRSASPSPPVQPCAPQADEAR